MINYFPKQLHIINRNIIPSYRITKTVMICKIEVKLLQVSGIPGVEETQLFLDKGK